LPVLGPTIGRVDRQYAGALARRTERGLVHGRDHLQARREHLLGVAQMADDFFGGPVLEIGPSDERGLILSGDRGGEVIGGPGHAVHALLQRLLRDLFQRRDFVVLLRLRRPRGA
jgi:hypothetical protein